MKSSLNHYVYWISLYMCVDWYMKCKINLCYWLVDIKDGTEWWYMCMYYMEWSASITSISKLYFLFLIKKKCGLNFFKKIHCIYFQLTVLNPLDGSIKYSKPIEADSVQVNPSQPIIAVKCKFPHFVNALKPPNSHVYWNNYCRCI